MLAHRWLSQYARSYARYSILSAIVLAPLLARLNAPLITTMLLAPLVVATVLMAMSPRLPQSLRPNVVALAMLLPALLCMLQLIPLPADVVGFLSPAAAEIISVTSRVTVVAERLSLEPSGTAHGALKLVALAIAAWLAPRLFRSGTHRHRIACAISVAGVLVFAVGMLEPLLNGQTSLVPLAATFANANHAGTFLGFASLVALAASARSIGSHRLLLTVAAIATASGVFLSLSRGAIIAYIAACSVWLLTARGRRFAPATKVTAIASVLAVAIIVVALSSDSVVTELRTLFEPGRFEKTELWRNTLPLVRDFVWTGCGRGAFAAVFGRYDGIGEHLTYTHVENAILQPIVDFGVLGALGVVAWCIALVSAWRIAENRLDKRAFAIACGYVSLENLADFNLELMAVALPVVVVLSVSQSRLHVRRERPRTAEMTRGNRRWVIGCAVLTCAAAVVLAPLAVRYSIARDTAMARQVSCASGEGTAIVARHPADFVIPLVIAERQLACANVPRSVFSLLNLAQYMAPQQSLPHRLTGRALLRLGKRDQAIAEYARAVSLQPLLVQSLLLELVARVGDIAIVTSVAARSPDNYLEVARFALWQHAPTVAHEVLAVGETTNDPEYFEVAAQTDLALEDWHAALASSNALERLNPSQSIAYTIQATALQRLSRIDDALAVLERGSRRGVDRGELSRAQFELLDRQGRYSEAREVALALLKVATSAAQISSAHAWLGNIHRREGNDLKALHEYERARDISPRIPIYRHLVASLRMELGDEQGAIAELRRARDELGPSPLFEPSSLAQP